MRRHPKALGVHSKSSYVLQPFGAEPDLDTDAIFIDLLQSPEGVAQVQDLLFAVVDVSRSSRVALSLPPLSPPAAWSIDVHLLAILFDNKLSLGTPTYLLRVNTAC